MRAATNGHTRVLELLLNGGARVNEKSGAGWTACMLAAAAGHQETMEVLLVRGADPRAKAAPAPRRADISRIANGIIRFYYQDALFAGRVTTR